MAPSSAVSKAMSMADGHEAGPKLGIVIGGKNIEQPGQYVPKADAQALPELTLASSSSSGPYLGVVLDLDAPFKSFPILGPILHWLQPGLTTQGAESAKTLAAPPETPPIAEYAGPGPPPGSGPHRYVFMVYEQPADFDAKKFAAPEGQTFPVTKRMRFDMDRFVSEAKLGAPVAVNYFGSN